MYSNERQCMTVRIQKARFGIFFIDFFKTWKSKRKISFYVNLNENLVQIKTFNEITKN